MKPAGAWTGVDTRPSVSLGRSMPMPVPRAAASLPMRRRLSGGGAVLRGPWLLRAALRLPPGHALLRGGPTQAAHRFGQIHAQWLRRMGLAEIACYEGPQQEHWSCFAGRARGEVMVGQRKIVGIAQAWRRQAVLLSSGTLLSPVPWSMLAEALGSRAAQDLHHLEPTSVDATQCLGRLRSQAWAASLQSALDGALLTADAPTDPSAAVWAASVPRLGQPTPPSMWE